MTTQREATAAPSPALRERQAYTIPEFCEAHGIGRSTYYLLRAEGRAPAEIRVGRKGVRISLEAAAAWRKRHARQGGAR